MAKVVEYYVAEDRPGELFVGHCALGQRIVTNHSVGDGARQCRAKLCACAIPCPGWWRKAWKKEVRAWQARG